MVYLATCITKINQIVEVDIPFVPDPMGNGMSFQGFHHWAQIEIFVASTGSKGALAVYIRLHFLSTQLQSRLDISIYPYILHACLFGLIVLNLLNFVFLLLVNYYQCYCDSCYCHYCFFFLDRLLFELSFITFSNIWH